MLVLALFAAKVVISSSSRVKRDTSSIAERTWGVLLGLDADYCGCWVDTKPSHSVPVGGLHAEKPDVIKEQPVACSIVTATSLISTGTFLHYNSGVFCVLTKACDWSGYDI
jgi:hypothetical protein